MVIEICKPLSFFGIIKKAGNYSLYYQQKHRIMGQMKYYANDFQYAVIDVIKTVKPLSYMETLDSFHGSIKNLIYLKLGIENIFPDIVYWCKLPSNLK